MSIFPTHYSTLDASALGAYICEKYGFTGLSCRLLIRNVSDTYILENGHDRDGFYEDNFDDFSNTFLTPGFLRDRIKFIQQWMTQTPTPLS